MLPLELLVVGSSAVVSHAIQIPIHRRSLSRAYPVDVSTYCDWGTDPFAFTSLEGMAYTGTIQVGGASFSVQLDTGSSDLWLDTANATLSNLTSTGRNASIIYESLTGAAGPIDVGNVTWGEFMFPQAFINAPGSNATGEGEIDGVLGLGPPYSSSIRTELETSRHDGSSFITNLFKHYPDVPNFLTFLLGRSSAGESDGGVFTIGELLTELEAIIDEPALPALTNWAWVTLVDAVIINGARYSGGAFPGSIGKLLGNSRQTAAVLDTGTSTSTAPPQYVDAMYKHLPGARFDSKNRRYYVPCDTKLNISIVFAGSHLYPMHPLDVINPDHVENGSLMCTGSFEYEANYTGIDFLLGDSFMRNVYSLFEFGSWTKPGAAEPHMKLPTGLCSQLCATLQP
ncbi:A1 family peptidase [Phanerochaete sordida]|uniref:A1 family peptidase n=1 Tax=Phanerochaete sordida TaxID=48140 RepID=A0A9P3LG97_9APHY|nr:A1 family peptidase [Phanerochaete sordida]